MTAIRILEKIIACGGECNGEHCAECPLHGDGWLCAFQVFSFSQREQLLEAAKTKLTQLVLDKMLEDEQR